MRWPWRRTPGRHAAGTLVPAPPPPPAPVPTPASAPPSAPPSAQPAPRTGVAAGVRLGFDDGSEVQLAVGDPRAQALQAVADVLLHGRRG